MTIFKSIILGIVQGITEFLPISSSGHLSLFQHYLGVSGEGSLLFSVLLHLGTLTAVFIVFYKTILELIVEFFQIFKDVFTGKFTFKNMDDSRRMLFMFVVSCLPLLLLLLPVGGGYNLMDKLSVFSEDESILMEGFCFLFTAFLLLFSSWRAKNQRTHSQIRTKDAAAVGFAQMLAAGFPGISRSGSTISTGMIMGVDKEYMVRYSFILGIPAILAANVVEIKDALEVESQIDLLPAIIGIIVATAAGVLSIKALQLIMKKDLFKYFGYYCLILGIAVIAVETLELF